MNKLSILSDGLNPQKTQGLAIKLFQHNEAKAAMDFADNGARPCTCGILIVRDCPEAPSCFKRSASEWGHLCDMDVHRLVSTARSLGVVVIVVSRRGMRGQHIDLCGGPLRKAKELCQ